MSKKTTLSTKTIKSLSKLTSKIYKRQSSSHLSTVRLKKTKTNSSEPKRFKTWKPTKRNLLLLSRESQNKSFSSWWGSPTQWSTRRKTPAKRLLKPKRKPFQTWRKKSYQSPLHKHPSQPTRFPSDKEWKDSHLSANNNSKECKILNKAIKRTLKLTPWSTEWKNRSRNCVATFLCWIRKSRSFRKKAKRILFLFIEKNQPKPEVDWRVWWRHLIDFKTILIFAWGLNLPNLMSLLNQSTSLIMYKKVLFLWIRSIFYLNFDFLSILLKIFCFTTLSQQ